MTSDYFGKLGVELDGQVLECRDGDTPYAIISLEKDGWPFLAFPVCVPERLLPAPEARGRQSRFRKRAGLTRPQAWLAAARTMEPQVRWELDRSDLAEYEEIPLTLTDVDRFHELARGDLPADASSAEVFRFAL